MENNLKHSDLACSIPSRFSFSFRGGSKLCRSIPVSQHWLVLGSQHCVRSFCAIETLGPCLGGSCPTASQGELYFRRIHIPGGKEKPTSLWVGSSSCWGRAQQLMLAGLSLTPVLVGLGACKKPQCPAAVAAPWCHRSHLLSPLPCPGLCWLWP